MEADVNGFLHFQYDLATEKDDVFRQSMLDDAPTMPEEYLLVRRLRVFAGPNGGLPFLVEGGYMDQPYITVLAIEACILGEERYQAFLNQNGDKPD